MCFIGPNNPIKVKKGEVVNVVKIVNITPTGEFIPYFAHSGHIKTYEVGKTYDDVFDKHFESYDLNTVRIENGIHSYLAKHVILKPFGVKVSCGLRIEEDYNVFRNYDMYGVIAYGLAYKKLGTYLYDNLITWPGYSSYHLGLLAGHIPEGATYYINMHGEVVSDKLTVDFIKPYWNGLYGLSQFKKD